MNKEDIYYKERIVYAKKFVSSQLLGSEKIVENSAQIGFGLKETRTIKSTWVTMLKQTT